MKYIADGATVMTPTRETVCRIPNADQDPGEALSFEEAAERAIEIAEKLSMDIPEPKEYDEPRCDYYLVFCSSLDEKYHVVQKAHLAEVIGRLHTQSVAAAAKQGVEPGPMACWELGEKVEVEIAYELKGLKQSISGDKNGAETGKAVDEGGAK